MTIQLLAGDARDVLPTLAADSVHTVVTSPPYYALRSYLDAAHPDKHREIGSEPTPDEYLATMVAVFREVRRVLRPDGCAFVNIGDSYVSGATGSLGTKTAFWKNGGQANQAAALDRPSKLSAGKPKDLLLMPARLALALQADGWWVRSDIIWHKPNPMPESCTDRPTSAHEHVFLLTKSARYYYDADAVREEPTGRTDTSRVFHTPLNGEREMREYPKDGLVGRNLRNVWTIATEAFPSAHFATYPSALAERCIRAGTSERGCCAACGKPWGRIVEKPKPPRDVYTQRHAPTDEMIYSGTRVDGVMVGSGQKLQDWLNANPAVTTGWQPGCDHGADVVPCRVLDPFAGAGTTLLCSDRLQRDAIGIELNVAYTEMAMERCRADAPLFTSFPPAEDPEETRMADLFAGDEYQQMPAAVPKPQRVPTGWDTGPGAHGTIHRNGRTMPEAAE